jgi:hypothetical protein
MWTQIFDLVPEPGFPSLPEPDYPAAHSMSTTWFAVDANGHVAAFNTHLDGHAPVGAEERYARRNYLEVMYRLLHPAADSDEYWSEDQLAEDLGVFLYEYRDEYDPIDVFERRVIPDRPTHVEQLPPEVRAMANKVHLPISFGPTEQIQPLEFLECTYWEEDGERFAYLASDGLTVRPILGKEDRFAVFVRKFREENPGEATRYRFEGAVDGH